RWCIDRNRIFGTGISSGGGMTVYVACRTHRFAAVAPLAPFWPTPECYPDRPTPVIGFQGVVDQVLPYGGTERGYGQPVHRQPPPQPPRRRRLGRTLGTRQRVRRRTDATRPCRSSPADRMDGLQGLGRALASRRRRPQLARLHSDRPRTPRVELFDAVIVRE